MAHATTRRTAARTTIALAAAGLTIGIATPAEAIISPAYTNTVRYTVAQTPDWETLSNVPMIDALAVPGFGWRAGFRVRVGVRWDSGLFDGHSWGNVEARAHLWVDTPRGPATMRQNFALVAVHAVPAFNGQFNGRCQAHREGWNLVDPVAFKGSDTCSAPTVAGPHSNYTMGDYSACVVVSGLAFADQPSSWFNAVHCPRAARRI